MKRPKSSRFLLAVALVAFTCLAALTIATGYVLTQQKAAAERLNNAITLYDNSFRLADQLRQSSDDLTRMVRSYAATGDRAFAEHFYTILDIRDGKAPRPTSYDRIFWDFKVAGETPPGIEDGERVSLQQLMEQAGFSDEELRLLAEAKRRSDRLVEMEETAMNAMEGRFRDGTGEFTIVKDPDRELALRILFGNEYHQAKSDIMRPIGEVLKASEERTSKVLADAQNASRSLSSVLVFLLGSFLVVLPVFVFVGYRYHRVLTAESRENEELFRATFEQAAVGIAHVSPDGSFLRINDRFCEIIGYTPDEMLARTFQEITHPDDLGADLEHVQRMLRGEAATYSIEKRYWHKRGHIVWVNLTVSLLRDKKGAPDFFVSVMEDITDRKNAEAQIIAYQERLRALASELTLSEERERRRIATELHDGPAQSLAFARMQLASARKAALEEETAVKMDAVSQILREALQQIRDVLLDLSSPLMNEIGLGVAISDWLEQQAGRRHGLRTSFADEWGEVPVDDDVGVVLFRNTRELLMNVVKHAQADTVSVRMESTEDALRITVEDDGIGFDLDDDAPAPDGGEFGLFSIRERMTDMGGSLEITSTPGEGTRATLVAPTDGDGKGVSA